MTKFNVTTVLFDFGGTLAYNQEPVWQKYKWTLLSTLKDHGHRMNLERLNKRFDKLYIRNSQGKFKNYEQFWTVFLKEENMAKEKTLIEGLENARRKTIRYLFKAYPRAVQTLTKLQKTYRLALVSNCSLNTREEIENLDLARFFEHMSLSYEVRVRKPDKRIYLDALNALHVEGDECVFVADEISDLEGARLFEMKTLLVRQGSSTFEDAEDVNFKPDAECDKISEVARFL
jgi:HAD superfamily hydrolase (TIGR01509 family)